MKTKSVHFKVVENKYINKIVLSVIENISFI